MTDSAPSMESQLLDDNDEEFLTPGEVLQRMRVAWQNELAAPCLMPTEMELVDILLDQIAGMEENIAKQREKLQLKISLHRMELQRISYMTSDYVRTRLRKIESNPRFVLSEHDRRRTEGQPQLLSDVELEFAQKYADAEAQLFSKTVLGFMPTALQKMPMPMEDMNVECVYVKVVADDVGEVTLPDNMDINSEVVIALEKDSVHLIPFQPVRHLVEQGKLALL